jgi:twitching motility protein PilU
MQQALTYAETGHLCVATLHANNANQALERIINFFPETTHTHILMDLSMHLNAIVSQRLCLGIDRKRVAVMELMFNSGHVCELIRQGKIEEIKEARAKPLDEVRTTIENKLTQESKNQIFKNYVEGLKKKFNIVLHPDVIETN